MKGGYDEMTWTVRPETDPTPDGYFWSHQVALAGGPAAYAGVQTVGSEPTGKIAIFSVWDALAAEGEVFAAPFGGEGEGWSVRVPFEWAPGETYTLSIERADAAAGTWWKATIDGTAIGRIRVPDGWGGLAETSIMWTERYAGPLSTCADIRHASAVFGTPSSRGVEPRTHRNHLSMPVGCPGSSVADVIDAGRRSVRHVMGAGRA